MSPRADNSIRSSFEHTHTDTIFALNKQDYLSFTINTQFSAASSNGLEHTRVQTKCRHVAMCCLRARHIALLLTVILFTLGRILSFYGSNLSPISTRAFAPNRWYEKRAPNLQIWTLASVHPFSLSYSIRQVVCVCVFEHSASQIDQSDSRWLRDLIIDLVVAVVVSLWLL